MDIEPKIENPVCIRFGDTENVILADEINKQSTPLVPGVMFVGNHYGFVLITDINGKQKEMVYPTQCRIVAVAFEGGTLKIFEEGKKTFWRFSNSGKLEYSVFGEFLMNIEGDLKAFENGKYHPWLFSYDGNFKQ